MMKKTLLGLAVFCLGMAAVHAGDKLSMSTHLFLSEMKNASENTRVQPVFNKSLMFKDGISPNFQNRFKGEIGQHIARPYEMNGVLMIDAFIGLNGTSTAELEQLGVKIQNHFDGFVTAAIPVDKIEEVAALANVEQVQVSQMLKIQTDEARKTTHADQVLNGLRNGIGKDYDGTGVIVGVIDTGIDPQHEAFLDANGKTRIKLLRQVSQWGTVTDITDPDKIVKAKPVDTEQSHGTHTSTTAGGKLISTPYGDFCGIAPNCDLVLCDLASLTESNIANSVKAITDYADKVKKPCVISISLGGQVGPHDGKEFICKVYNNATRKPGHIVVLAASNSAGTKSYVYKQGATKESPLATQYVQTATGHQPGMFYPSGIARAWARTANVPLAVQVYVLDKDNKIVKKFDEVTATNGRSGKSLNVSQYYKASYMVPDPANLTVYVSKDNNKCYSAWVKTSNLYTTKTYGNFITYSQYKLAFSVYPAEANKTTDIDVWEGEYGEFTGGKIGDDLQGVVGSDMCSASSECYADSVITVGSYITKNSFKGKGSHSYTNKRMKVGDISDFSSYVAENYGPGNKYTIPWITAPGQIIVAGVNHYDKQNYGSNIGFHDEYQYICQSNPTSFFGTMSGTSMATPVAAGIVALWLQKNNKLRVYDVREIMKRTAITDEFTGGTHKANFGNGKINAMGAFQTAAVKTVNTTPMPEVYTRDGYIMVDGEISYLTIYDLQGRTVSTDASVQLAKGIYLVKLGNAQGGQWCTKVVVD